MSTRGHSKKVAICKPRREASGESNPAGTLTLVSLQSCENINACGLSCLGRGTLMSQPQQVKTRSLRLALNLDWSINLTRLYRDSVTRGVTAEA